jgi:hypothetical protein
MMPMTARTACVYYFLLGGWSLVGLVIFGLVVLQGFMVMLGLILISLCFSKVACSVLVWVGVH